MEYGRVVFKSQHGFSGGYDYQTSLKDLEFGDLVIVEARDWFQVARFEGYMAKPDRSGLKNIIAVLDMDEIEKNKEIEEEKQRLKDEIELRVSEIEEEKRLGELAESDSSLKELIDQLNSLK